MRPFKFIKGQRQKPQFIRDIIIMFFAHWTGYASDGRRTGISSNPSAARLEERIYNDLGDAWDIYDPKNPAAKIYKKILQIQDKYKAKYNPKDSTAPYYVGRQINAAWPEIEEFLNTTPLLDNIGEKANKLARKKYMNEANIRHYYKSEYNDKSIRDLLILYFKHWTGYATDGEKSGLVGNPKAIDLYNYLQFVFGDDKWAKINRQLINGVLDICDGVYGKEEDYPDDEELPMDVEKLKAVWPEVENYLDTASLGAEKFRESKMKNITFKDLKKILTEEMYRYDYRDTDEWGSEIDDAKRWEISYYFRNNGQFAGTAVVSAATREEARRSFFEDDLAFDRRKVRIGSIRLYEED